MGPGVRKVAIVRRAERCTNLMLHWHTDVDQNVLAFGVLHEL